MNEPAQPDTLGRPVADCAVNGRSKRHAVDVIAVVLIALAARLLIVYQTADVPFARHLVGDAAGYFAWGQRIAAGDWFGSQPFYQAPLYPHVLGGVFSLFASQIWVVRVVQAVLGAAATGLLGIATATWFGRRAGFLAGLMLAVYPPAIFYDGLIQKTSVGGLLTCALLVTLSGVMRSPHGWRYALLGILVALLSLTRENALVWLPLLGLGVAVQPAGLGRRARLARLGFYIAGLTFVLAPVTIRNHALGGGFSPTTSQAGPNFYIGNHTGADGRYQPLVRGHETPEFERADATRLAEEAEGRSLLPSEVSAYWMSRAWHDIRSDPVAWARLLGRKSLLVVNDYEVADAEGMVVYADASWLLAGLKTVWRFGVLLPLAAVGMFLARRSWRRYWVLWAMIATMAIAVTLFFVLGRYRYPLVPLLIPFAASGCLELWTLVGDRRWGEGARAVTVGLVVAVVGCWPVHGTRRLDALARMNAGVALARSGDIVGATGWFESAVSGCPDSPEANVNLAQALAQLGEMTDDPGDFERAVEHYRKAAEVAPELPGLYYNLGVALERLGRYAAAKDAYERALTIEPGDKDARQSLGRLSVGE